MKICKNTSSSSRGSSSCRKKNFLCKLRLLTALSKKKKMVLFVDVWCFFLRSTKYGIFRRTAISKKISNTLPRGFCRKSAWHQRYLKVQQSKGWDNVFFCNGTIVKHHSIPYFTTLTLYLCTHTQHWWHYIAVDSLRAPKMYRHISHPKLGWHQHDVGRQHFSSFSIGATVIAANLIWSLITWMKNSLFMHCSTPKNCFNIQERRAFLDV